MSRKGGGARSSGNRASSRSNRGNSSRRRSSSATRSRSTTASRRRTSSSNGQVSKAGGKVAEFASKAKTPLVAGGAALAGIAGGVALKSRTESRRPLKALRSVSMPKSLKHIDLEQLIDAGRKVRALGEQVGDVADTAEKARKKHK